MAVGTTLGESYRILRVVGAGGFGVTYEAEDIHLGTSVALKEFYPGEIARRTETLDVLPASDGHSKLFEWGRASFLREARTLAKFRHASIVRVFRVFEDYGTVYMAMEFERGSSFYSWLARLGRPPSQEELDCIVSPLLEALELMHADGFLHRDIAPDNIIVRENMTPVLLDFGAARKSLANTTNSLTGMFKDGYSPQEQYSTDGKFQGPWSDFYALGATVYFAVAGFPPLQAPSRSICDTLLPAIRVSRARYRSNFLEGIDECLRLQPSDRPQSVGRLRSLLFEAERQTTPVVEAVEPHAPPNVTTIPSRSLRRFYSIGLSAVVFLSLLAFVVVKWIENKSVRQRAEDAKIAAEKTSRDIEDRQKREAEEQRIRALEERQRALREQELQTELDRQARERERIERERRIAEELKPPSSPAPSAPVALPSPPAETPPIPAAPAKAAALREFDGVWIEVSVAGNSFCERSSNTLTIRISGASVSGSSLLSGSIYADGNIRFVTPNANRSKQVLFIGRIKGSRGGGSYSVLGGKCKGTFSMTRN